MLLSVLLDIMKSAKLSASIYSGEQFAIGVLQGQKEERLYANG
jgi:hypothetical protein